jgi:hypothetical protein
LRKAKLPVLPYAGTSGWSGSDTSRKRNCNKLIESDEAADAIEAAFDDFLDWWEDSAPNPDGLLRIKDNLRVTLDNIVRHKKTT